MPTILLIASLSYFRVVPQSSDIADPMLFPVLIMY